MLEQVDELMNTGELAGIPSQVRCDVFPLLTDLTAFNTCYHILLSFRNVHFSYIVISFNLSLFLNIF